MCSSFSNVSRVCIFEHSKFTIIWFWTLLINIQILPNNEYKCWEYNFFKFVLSSIFIFLLISLTVAYYMLIQRCN